MPGFFCSSMPDTYRRQSAPGGVQIDKTRPRLEPGKKFKPRKPRGKCTLLRAGGAEQAPRGTGAYCVFPLPRTPTRKMLTGGEVIRQEFLLWKKVPGIFREPFFMQLPEGLKGNGFSVIFHFP